MKSIKTSYVMAILGACLLIALVFISKSSKWTESTISYIPPSSQTASISGANSGLVAHYTFDDGTATDSSGNGNNGTLTNGPTATTGKVGGALMFDGTNDYVQTASISAAGLTGLSYSFWVRQTGTLASNSSMISWGGTKRCKIYTGNAVLCSVLDSNTSAAQSSTKINDGNWHHIVFTSTASAQIIYVDGVAEGSGTQTLSTASGVLRIGANSYSTPANFYGGTIDDVRIYNRVLSANEIQELYTINPDSVPVPPTVPETPVVEVVIPEVVVPEVVVPAGEAGKIYFSDLFEVGDYYTWSSNTATGNGALNVVSYPVYSGDYALSSSVNTSGKAYLIDSFVDVGSALSEVNQRVYFNISNDFSIPSGSSAIFLSVAKSGLGSQVNISLSNTASGLVLSSSRGGASSVPLSKNRWYSLEVKYKSGTANGEVRVYLDGAEIISATNQNLSNTVNEIRLGLNTSVSVTGGLFFDDVLVSDKHIGFRNKELNIIHAPFFGHLGMNIISIQSGQTGSDTLRAVLTGTNGYNQTIFQKSSPSGREDFVLNLRNLSSGNYTLKVSLINSSGIEIDSVEESFSKPYSGIPKVGIDEYNAININGVPTFLVTPFGLRASDIKTWADNSYINSIYGRGWDYAQTPENFGAELNTAVTNGLIGGLGPTGGVGYVDRERFLNDTNPYKVPTDSVIANYVNGLRNNPNLIGWVWRDEPITNNDAPVEWVKHWTEETHRLDSQHLVFNTEYGMRQANPQNDPWFIDLMHKFMYPNIVADVYLFDTYPIEYSNKGFKMSELAQVADWYRKWNFDLIPFMAFVETCDARPGVGTPAPTAEQLRMMVWINVVHGVKGISWYHYQGATPPENFVEMARFTKQIKRLESVILKPDAVRTVTDNANVSGQRVDTLVKENDTDIYIFAVRVTEIGESSNHNVQFNVSGLPGNLTVDVFDESRQISVNNGIFSDSFAPNAVHIYRIPKSGAVPPVTPPIVPPVTPPVTPPTPTPINGTCGTTLNICSFGTLNNIADSTTNYLWQCLGANGGTSAQCSLAIPVTPPVTPPTGGGSPSTPSSPTAPSTPSGGGTPSITSPLGGGTPPQVISVTIPTPVFNPPVLPATGYASYYFSRHLTIGSTGNDVKILQQTLNSLGYTISSTGPGSSGNETTYYGPATTLAIQKFQCAILRICSGSPTTNGYGNFGPATRVAMSQRTGGSSITPTSVTPVTPVITTSSSFTRSLKLGMTGTDVKTLQVFLNNRNFKVSTTGPGSPNNETTYFGPATARAVSAFQEAYTSEILAPNGLTRGTGFFGPSTMRKANTLLSN